MKEPKTLPPGPILLLDDVQDVGNFGSIVRTADFYGVKTIFKTGKSAPNNDAVSRISKDANKNLDIIEVKNLATSIKNWKKQNYWLCASYVTPHISQGSALPRQQAFYEHTQTASLPLNEHLILAIGNEEKGIRTLLLKESDYILHIPVKGQTSCLNAAVATAVLLDRIIFRG